MKPVSPWPGLGAFVGFLLVWFVASPYIGLLAFYAALAAAIVGALIADRVTSSSSRSR